MLRSRLCLAVLAGLFAVPAWAQSGLAGLDPDDPSPFSDVALVAGVTSAQPGEPVEVAVVLSQEPGWHSYWTNPGDSGATTQVEWDLPDGWSASELRFPAPEAISLAGIVSYGHEDEVVIFATLTPPDGASGVVELGATVEWLICADVCLPAEGEVALALPIRDEAPAPDPVWASRLERARAAAPRSVAGWTAEALADAETYRLRLIPPPGWSGSMDGVEVFASEPHVVGTGGERTWSRDGEAYTVDLPVSPAADGTAERLRAVLTGADFDPQGTAPALAIDAPVLSGSAAALVGDAPASASGLTSIWTAILFAFAGGLLLNLMPCVFPILSIKIMGFVGGREAGRDAMRRHGLAFGVGVLLSFLALAGLLLALRAAGQELGWGFQLQTPGIIAALALLMTALGLWMLGVVEFGGRLAAMGGRLDQKSGVMGAFLSGVLATVVAAPCTAPFMGAALGYALGLPALGALAIFGALGIGMALPVVLLSWFPAWLERLPRPGAWMETLKQALAFPLLLTAVWLVWVFAGQAGTDAAGALLVALVLVGFAAWLLGRWPAVTASSRVRVATRSLALAAAVGALALVVWASGADAATPTAEADADGWAPYDPAEVETLVAAGTPVFVDFTATWCWTCQVNKTTTLHTDRVEEAFRARGVHRVRADWTSRDPVITAALEQFGRAGVPVYVLYPGGDAEPVVLPEVLSPGLVIDALDAIAPPSASL